MKNNKLSLQAAVTLLSAVLIVTIPWKKHIMFDGEVRALTQDLTAHPTLTSQPHASPSLMLIVPKHQAANARIGQRGSFYSAEKTCPCFTFQILNMKNLPNGEVALVTKLKRNIPLSGNDTYAGKVTFKFDGEPYVKRIYDHIKTWLPFSGGDEMLNGLEHS